MKMELTGPGVYLMNGWDKMSLRPKEALTVLPGIPGSLGGCYEKKEAMVLFISFSARHNAWCGVTWPRLLEEMRSKYRDERKFRAIKREIESMIKWGLLEIPKRYKRWYSKWLNAFEPKIICPGLLLGDMITAHARKNATK